MTDTDAMCGPCIDGDHDECNTTDCACTDMEHDGDRYGEIDSDAPRLEFRP